MAWCVCLGAKLSLGRALLFCHLWVLTNKNLEMKGLGIYVFGKPYFLAKNISLSIYKLRERPQPHSLSIYKLFGWFEPTILSIYKLQCSSPQYSLSIYKRNSIMFKIMVYGLTNKFVVVVQIILQKAQLYILYTFLGLMLQAFKCIFSPLKLNWWCPKSTMTKTYCKNSPMF